MEFSAPNVIKLMLFGLTLFLSNFGPNPTTFIISSEVFPSQIRSGKAGAVTGGAGFPQALETTGLNGVMYGVSFAGFLVTFLFLQSKKVEALINPADSLFLSLSGL